MGIPLVAFRGTALSFLLDGVDVSEQLQGGTFIQTSIDALQEFSVEQNPYSAEFNRGGGFFNATTKSGTNQFHGDLFEFLRNDKLDARNFFALTARASQTQSIWRHARRTALHSRASIAARTARFSSAAMKGSVCAKVLWKIASCRPRPNGMGISMQPGSIRFTIR